MPMHFAARPAPTTSMPSQPETPRYRPARQDACLPGPRAQRASVAFLAATMPDVQSRESTEVDETSRYTVLPACIAGMDQAASPATRCMIARAEKQSINSTCFVATAQRRWRYDEPNRCAAAAAAAGPANAYALRSSPVPSCVQLTARMDRCRQTAL